LGLTPTHWVKTRWKCAGLMDMRAASASSDSGASAASISSMARRITW
jgi:hypothetical protein